jgi:MFS superfamily sulfate permease-like transporter
MDFGILFGVVVALVDHVASTTRVSSLSRVNKRSRALWSQEDWNVLQLHGYHGDHPKIATLEIKGSVFFGSSQKLLTVRICLTFKNNAENNFADDAISCSSSERKLWMISVSSPCHQYVESPKCEDF